MRCTVWEASCWSSSWERDGGGYQGPRSIAEEGTRRSLRAIGRSSCRQSWEWFGCNVPITIVRIVGEEWFPRTAIWTLASTSFSPGVRRMMGRVGAKEPFEEGQRDLQELAGVALSTKAVERVSEGIGSEVENVSEREREQAFSEKIVPFASPPARRCMWRSTGPACRSGLRKWKVGWGKGADRPKRGRRSSAVSFRKRVAMSKVVRFGTRESTTYVGAIEEAVAFGARIYTEAARRGATRAPRLVVLGDGAPWIWGIAAEHFHQAIQIVDLYHARQRLFDLGKTVLGLNSPEAQQWVRLNQELLDRGDVEASSSRCDDSQQLTKPLARRGRPASSTSERMRSECVTLASAARDFSSARASSKRAARPSLANV